MMMMLIMLFPLRQTTKKTVLKNLFPLDWGITVPTTRYTGQSRRDEHTIVRIAWLHSLDSVLSFSWTQALLYSPEG